ncbi:MAG: hypothetical protein PSY12_09610, partial [bacterium]|nr:hypothetical protein [bacterium]
MLRPYLVCPEDRIVILRSDTDRNGLLLLHPGRLSSDCRFAARQVTGGNIFRAVSAALPPTRIACIRSSRNSRYVSVSIGTSFT